MERERRGGRGIWEGVVLHLNGVVLHSDQIFYSPTHDVVIHLHWCYGFHLLYLRLIRSISLRTQTDSSSSESGSKFLHSDNAVCTAWLLENKLVYMVVYNMSHCLGVHSLQMQHTVYATRVTCTSHAHKYFTFYRTRRM